MSLSLSPRFLIRRPAFRLRHVALVWLAVFASAALCAGEASKLPLPPEFLEAKILLKKIEAAETVPDEAKEQAKTQFAAVDEQFKKLWEPIEKIYIEALQYKEQLKFRKAEFEKRVDAHNAKPHVFTEKQQAEHQAYDAEKASLDAEQERNNREIDERNKAFTEKCAKLAKPLDAWLKGPSLRDFKRTGQALLDGKVKFTKGLAWAQLTKAAGLGEASGQVIENSDPNRVNAADVKPWTPEERSRELAKPRVQPLYRPKLPEPPPPPPGADAKR